MTPLGSFFGGRQTREVDNFRSGSVFVCSCVGGMIQSMAENIQSMKYHHTGKVSEVKYLNSDYIRYFYDHGGDGWARASLLCRFE